MSSSTFRRHMSKTVVLLAGALVLVLYAVGTNEAQTTTAPGGDTRQPIVSNQFTTTSGSALQARAPGSYTQQAIAIQQGTLFPFDGNVPDTTPWVRQTFDMLFLQFVDIITNLVDTISGFVTGSNALSGLLGNGNSGLGGLGSVLSNPLTSGGGTSTPLN